MKITATQIFCLVFVLYVSVACAKKKNVIKEQPKKNTTEEQHPKIRLYNKNAYLRPTKCQVCRILVTELMVELNRTANNRDVLHLSSRLDEDGDEYGKTIDYSKSEIRLMDSIEKVCGNTAKYKSIAGPDFPYLTGVKSMFQSELENMMGKSGLKMKLDAPQDIVDDPTMEIRRLRSYCNQMIETNEEDIEEWYMKHSGENPLDYICAERVLKGKDTDCLRASTVVPDFAPKPVPDDNKRIARGEL